MLNAKDANRTPRHRLLFWALVLLLPVWAAGQEPPGPRSAEDPPSKARSLAELLRKGEYGLAIAAAKEIAKAPGDRRASASFNLARVHQLYADSLSSKRDDADTQYRAALSAYGQAEQVFMQTQDDRKRLQTLERILEIYPKLPHAEMADRWAATLLTAIEVQKRLDPANESVIRWRKQLAEIYEKDFDKSQFHIAEAIREFERAYGPEDPKLIEYLAFEAHLQEQNDDFEAAAESYQRILELRLASASEQTPSKITAAYLDAGRTDCLAENRDAVHPDFLKGIDLLRETENPYRAGALGILAGVVEQSLGEKDRPEEIAKYHVELVDRLLAVHAENRAEDCSAVANVELKVSQKIRDRTNPSTDNPADSPSDETAADGLFTSYPEDFIFTKELIDERFKHNFFCGVEFCALDDVLANLEHERQQILERLRPVDCNELGVVDLEKYKKIREGAFEVDRLSKINRSGQVDFLAVVLESPGEIGPYLLYSADGLACGPSLEELHPHLRNVLTRRVESIYVELVGFDCPVRAPAGIEDVVGEIPVHFLCRQGPGDDLNLFYDRLEAPEELQQIEDDDGFLKIGRGAAEMTLYVKPTDADVDDDLIDDMVELIGGFLKEDSPNKDLLSPAAAVSRTYARLKQREVEGLDKVSIELEIRPPDAEPEDTVTIGFYSKVAVPGSE